MTKKWIAWTAAALLTAGTGIGAYAFAAGAEANRPECPGTIVCPLTGEIVCKDRCPVLANGAEEQPLSSCCTGR